MILAPSASSFLRQTSVWLMSVVAVAVAATPPLSAQIGVVVTTGGGNGGSDLLDIALSGATSNSRAISHQTITNFGFVGLGGIPGSGGYSGLSRTFSGTSYPDHTFGISPSGLASPFMTGVYFGAGDCALDPTTSHLWGMKQTGELYDLSFASTLSYQTTIVGAGSNLEAMAFDASGQLYVLEQGADLLHKVNKSTGLITSSIAVSLDTGLGNAAMAFDPAKPTELLVIAPVWNGSGAPHRLFSLNATTGACVEHGTTRNDITGFVPFLAGSTGGGGNGQGQGGIGGAMLMDMEHLFNLTVDAVTFETDTASPGGLGHVDVYVVPDSYVGHQFSPQDWILVGSTEPTTLPPGAQTVSASLATAFTLPPGRFGIALHGQGIAFRFGTVPGCASPAPGSCPGTTFANAEVTLRMGAALDGLFVGNSVEPAIFQGALGYRIGGVPMSLATSVAYGVGCGSQGPVALSAVGRPVLGSTLALTTQSGSLSPSNLGFMVLSLTKYDPGLPLVGLGMPGCFQYVGLDAVHVQVLSNGLGVVPFSIPNDAGLIGLSIRAQAVVRDPQSYPMPLAVSNGLDLTVGSR